MKCFRIRTFLAVNDVFGQFIGECAAHDAFLASFERLEIPRHIVRIFNNAVVAEGHANLETGVHAHAVLAVEQGGHKPVEVEHEHFAHAGRFFVIGRQLGCASTGVAVVLVHKFFTVSHRIGREKTQPQTDRPRPRKGILKQDFLAVVPRIAAEQLVGALAGQANGGSAALDCCAEQQQGGVHIRHAGQRTRVGGGQQSRAECLRFKNYTVMVRTEKIHHLINIRIVTIWLKYTLCKIFIVIPIIHRPGMQRFAAGSVVFSGQHGQDGRIQSAGQETRQRHIADQLTAGGIADERVCVLDGGRQVVLMLVRFELPVGVIGERFRRQNRKMSGQKGRNLPKDTRFRRTSRTEQQQCAQTVLVERRLDLRVAEHGVDGRTEGQTVANGCEKQRFHAQTVAAERQSTLTLLPDGKRENAVQPRKRIGFPLEIGVEQHFGVRMPGKLVPKRDEFRA